MTWWRRRCRPGCRRIRPLPRKKELEHGLYTHIELIKSITAVVAAVAVAALVALAVVVGWSFKVFLVVFIQP